MSSPAKGDVEARAIRVFLVDDHPIVLEGLTARLSEAEGIEVVGRASSGSEAIRRIPDAAPDLVLMDLGMPGMNGIETLRVLREQSPRRILVALTMHDDKEFVVEAMRAGASGYVLKDSPPSQLVEAIRRTHAGAIHFSPSVAHMLAVEYVSAETRPKRAPQGVKLSRREGEVLGLVAQGLSNRAIAERLRLSVRTVESHRLRLAKKLDAKSAAALARYAVAHGLVAPE